MASSYDRSAESVGVNDISRISAGSSIKGEITSPNDIRIDGNFEGKIISQAKVVVGEKAVIKGVPSADAAAAYVEQVLKAFLG